MGISNQNQELGLKLLDIAKTDYEEFQKRVDALPQSDREEIAWWYKRLVLYGSPTQGSA